MSRATLSDGPLPEDPEYLPYQFDQAWRGGNPPDLNAFLPAAEPGNEAVRRQVLQELIKIDLEYRWQQCASRLELRRTVEEYAVLYPKLGELSFDLITWEYRARHSGGDHPSHAEYLKRFPAHVSQLEAILRDIDMQLAAEFAGQSSGWVGRPAPSANRKRERPESVTHALANPDASPIALPVPQAELVQPLETVGMSIGPYILLERLGEGGAGRVYKARHQKMDRVAAVKVIRSELLVDHEMVRRFYREVEAVSQLQHSNVVHAYDAGPIQESGVGGQGSESLVRGHFLAMEFLEGIDLSRLVKQSGALPVNEAREYTCQAAVGLQYIHEHGMVHRDIKPSNLMLSRERKRPEGPVAHASGSEGTVKILDLGLARLQWRASGEATTSITSSKTVMMGTVDYMAPEQAIDSHAVDIRADIYSLGCTLFYLLTGQPPFPGGTEAQKLWGHQTKQPPDVRELRPEVPEDLVVILSKMLAKEPGQRFQTPDELVGALSGDAPVGTEGSNTQLLSAPVPLLNRSPKNRAMSRRKMLMAGVGGGLLLGLSSYLLLGLGATKRSAPSQRGMQTTRPVNPSKGRDLLFQDDFEDRKLSRWQVPADNHWRISRLPEGKSVLGEGMLSRPTENNSVVRHRVALQCGELSWRDYRFEVSVKFGAEDGFKSAILEARKQDEKNLYCLEYLLGPNNKSQIWLSCWVNGAYQDLSGNNADSVPPLKSGPWYRLRFEVQGNRLRGFVDGKPLVEAVDDKLESGRAGLCRGSIQPNGPTILWTDVRIEALPPLTPPAR
jgi:serine/threonine protein kinase